MPNQAVVHHALSLLLILVLLFLWPLSRRRRVSRAWFAQEYKLSSWVPCATGFLGLARMLLSARPRKFPFYPLPSCLSHFPAQLRVTHQWGNLLGKVKLVIWMGLAPGP